ncbi:MAG: phosphoribosyltransferase [Desulfosarcinaceae bacterium]|nr:phosphoribosyltransferase [Desulfosarcinaceae bacterium]
METSDKLFLTIEQAEILSMELAARIRDLYPDIDCVVGIANGGLMTASIVARELELPLHVLDIRRNGSRLKHKLFKVRCISTLLSACYTLPAFRNCMCRLSKHITRPVVRSSPDLKQYKWIAIVDDAVESGKTLVAAREELVGADDTKWITAVLSWSALYDSPIVGPDIFISRKIHHYPWSGNNPAYKDTLKWLADRGIQCLD